MSLTSSQVLVIGMFLVKVAGFRPAGDARFCEFGGRIF